MKKHLVFLLIAMILSMTVLLNGCSEIEEYTDNVNVESEKGLKFYPLSDGTYGVMANVKVDPSNVEIPSMYKTDAVTQVLPYAFQNSVNLTKVGIPESITSIGDSAFSGCTNLTSIVIPNGVTSIGKSVFSGCTDLTIFCEVESKPSEWSIWWNDSNCPVVWGYKGEE